MTLRSHLSSHFSADWPLPRGHEGDVREELGLSAPWAPGSPCLCHGSRLPGDPQPVAEKLQISLGTSLHLLLQAEGVATISQPQTTQGRGQLICGTFSSGVLIEVELDFYSD